MRILINLYVIKHLFRGGIYIYPVHPTKYACKFEWIDNNKKYTIWSKNSKIMILRQQPRGGGI